MGVGGTLIESELQQTSEDFEEKPFQSIKSEAIELNVTTRM